MTTDNVQMWKELGIDLKPHDMLLNALGPIYQEVYLSQKNRPAGMGFFDFVVGDIHGIRVKELREHAKNGGKVVATYCVFVPEEIVWAAGAIPVGLCAGAQFSVPIAEEVLPRNTCALIKSSFGFKLGRICPYVQASHLIVGETLTEEEVKEFCEQNLPRYKRPRRIIFDKVPRNPTGKIEKPKLRQRYAGQ